MTPTTGRPSRGRRRPERPRHIPGSPGPPPTGPVPPAPPHVVAPRPELSDAALVSRSWAMAFATLISRLTGFARIVLLAAILGAALSSAFSVANQLPNLVAALVLEATFTAIFVPVLARAEQDDADGGAAFVRRLVTLATTLLIVATAAVGGWRRPLLVRLMLGRNPQVNEPLTIAFAYLLLPQVLFYGLSSVFMAILNTRNVFGPPAWAPVVNNVVAIVTLGVYLAVPGELSVDPVQMGNAKLLVLGIGTTLGVFAQTAVLLVAIRRQRISLRPLWGIDDRLKRFGTMAAAMVLYVLISQLGLMVGNQIASTAAASGPAIYNYTWLVLMLPFGMIGVTVLTVVMPRLSRNAAADDTGGARRPVAGHPADDDHADPDGGVHDRRRAGDGQRAVRLRPFRRRRRRIPGRGDRAVGVHPDPLRAGAAAAAGVLRPRAAVDTDRDHPGHHGRSRSPVRCWRRTSPTTPIWSPATWGWPTAWDSWPARSSAISCCVATCGPGRWALIGVGEVRTILVTITASLLAGLIAHVVDGCRAGRAHRQRRRRRFVAAPVRAGADHGADHGRGHAARTGSRGARRWRSPRCAHWHVAAARPPSRANLGRSRARIASHSPAPAVTYPEQRNSSPPGGNRGPGADPAQASGAPTEAGQ